jgi:hypothetical protein
MMPTLEHSDYRFSVTTRTDDLAVVGCLRALADFSQKSGNKRIAWGGTTDAYWRRNGHSVTFRFSALEFRECFLREAERLLPLDLWTVSGTRDDDPASPQTR